MKSDNLVTDKIQSGTRHRKNIKHTSKGKYDTMKFLQVQHCKRTHDNIRAVTMKLKVIQLQYKEITKSFRRPFSVPYFDIYT